MFYEIIEHKYWQNTKGETASIYGALPWVNDKEKAQWRIVSDGYTILDWKTGTVGGFGAPFRSKSEARGKLEKFHGEISTRG